MKCLIDADVLRYEIGFSGEYVDEDGEVKIRDFEFVKELLDEKIAKIQEACWADEPPLLYMTYDRHFHKIATRERTRQGLAPLEYIPNFRYEIAVTKPYKERGNKKPFHYHNLTAYILSEYDVKVIPGLEADDAICIDQWEDFRDMEGRAVDDSGTIVCTRDKDLRMVPGWHYGWECGKQEGFGPKFIEPLGHLELIIKQTAKGPKKEIKGTGMLFFFAQMMTGDGVDSIPGLKGVGPAKVYDLLGECTSEEEAHEITWNLYKEKMGDAAEEYWKEQSGLLWMVRELSAEGRPIGFDGTEVSRLQTGEALFRRDDS